jgi:high-affinity Fe2+/Pb2+ permease
MTSPLPGVVLILAVWGAIVDWRYKRKGGNKSTKRDRLFFLTALAVVVGVLIVWGLIGSGDVAGMIGETIPLLVIVLFATWELGRWSVRSKHPLPQGSQV